MPSSDRPDQPPRSNRRALGRKYEEQAVKYLQSQGCTILDTNWQAGHREIDIVARTGNMVVFVEVKASSSTAFGHPAERVDRRKIVFLTRAAQQYLAEHDLDGCDFRFDLITVYKGKLEHYPAAFEADPGD